MLEIASVATCYLNWTNITTKATIERRILEPLQVVFSVLESFRKIALIAIPAALLIGAFYYVYSISIDSERQNAERTILAIGQDVFHTEVMKIFEKFRPPVSKPEPDSEEPTELLPGIDFFEVPTSSFNKAIESLKPLDVWVEANGVYIKLRQGPVSIEGIFVASGPLDFPADPDMNGLEQIGAHIYWFTHTTA